MDSNSKPKILMIACFILSLVVGLGLILFGNFFIDGEIQRR